jgi:hypothetical protein
MSNFREQLFQRFASQGITVSIEGFQSKYQPKKENRFNVDGITYETSPARLSDNAIEFEISSKIPQDELDSRDDFESYFSAIKTLIEHDEKRPVAMDMENIVQEIGGEDVKERDYVRLRYRYDFGEICDNNKIAAEVAKVQKDPSSRILPDLPNVNTLAGRVMLVCIEDFFREEATLRMERLIEANQEVRGMFKQQAKVGSKS